MTPLTAWLPLWEKCPELQPFGLRLHTAGWATQTPFPSEKPWSCVYNVVTEEEAAALIRDRAVWWLAAKATESGTFLCLQKSPQAALGMFGETQSVDTDPTEALRLAVCKVLEMTP